MLINWAQLIFNCKLQDKHDLIIEKIVRTEHYSITYYHCDICGEKLVKSSRLRKPGHRINTYRPA